MGRKRRKVHNGTREECQKPKIRTEDLISKLPDHVIHHILSFLPTIDAVRTSLLSRRWRWMWYSISALKLCYYEDKFEKEIFFDNFVEQCLKHRQVDMQCNKNSAITRFKLEMPSCGADSSQVDKWLSFVAQPHLKELDVNMHGLYSTRGWYCLPQVALNLTSLTILKLQDLKLEDSVPVNLPSLKSLSLSMVELKEEVLHNLVLGCPSLQKLFVREVLDSFSFNLRISSSSLKFLDIGGGWLRIRVDAINLESFLYSGYSVESCDFDIASCKKLTCLSMNWAIFDREEDFGKLISGFPFLETLTLIGCYPVDIRHQYLKVLILEKEEDWQVEIKSEISIDAPNLVSFSYSGDDTLLQIVMNSSNLLETNITLDVDDSACSMEWYVNILNFLSGLDCSKSINFALCSEEALIFPKNLRKISRTPSLPDLKHVKVKTRCDLRRESDLENALRWLSPYLETLSIEQEDKA